MNGRLIVEGIDDKYVISSLCKKKGVVIAFDIHVSEGFSNAREAFELSLKDERFECVGIIVDADLDVISRWDSLQNIIKKNGYTTKKTSDLDGFLLYEPTKQVPRVGIWIMPDNKTPGILEDFVQHLIPENDSLRDYSLRCVDNLPDTRFKSSYRSKAEIHTWLAWQEEPGTPMGLAVTKKYLSNVDSARKFLEWINRLFNEPFPKGV